MIFLLYIPVGLIPPLSDGSKLPDTIRPPVVNCPPQRSECAPTFSQSGCMGGACGPQYPMGCTPPPLGCEPTMLTPVFPMSCAPQPGCAPIPPPPGCVGVNGALCSPHLPPGCSTLPGCDLPHVITFPPVVLPVITAPCQPPSECISLLPPQGCIGSPCVPQMPQGCPQMPPECLSAGLQQQQQQPPPPKKHQQQQKPACASCRHGCTKKCLKKGCCKKIH